MTARAQEIRTGLAWLHQADPVLAQLIDEHPDFDLDVWIRRLPAMGLFGALVFQVIGQQISVIAAMAIFARLTGRFGGRVPAAGELAAVDQETLRGLGLSRRKAESGAWPPACCWPPRDRADPAAVTSVPAGSGFPS
jgi:3-methyladenine DNA glycosylase/8-oxoguanine DNA glycosylase